MTSSRSLAPLVLLATLAVAGSAFAQKEPSAADLETARGLYKEGRDLEKKGDLKGALEKLRAAHAVGRTPLTAIELARVEVQLGLVVEAREVCLGVARMPVASDESVRAAAARKDAAKLAEDLKAKVATVIIQLMGVAPSDHVTVSIDGVAIPDVALPEPRKVNPGKHTLIAHVDGGAEVQTDVEVGAAETKTVSLSPPPAPVVVTPPQDHGTPLTYQPIDRPQPPVSHRVSNAFAITGFTVAGIGIIGGAIAGVLTMNRESELETRCQNQHCGPADWTALDNARGLGDASSVLFVVGGIGLLTGVLALALRSPNHTTGISPRVGLDSIGVDGAF